jgi:predicted metal-dependent peptidase
MDELHTKRGTVALRRLAEYDPCFASLSLWCKHRDASPEAADVLLRDQDGHVQSGRISRELAPSYTDGETIWYGEQFTRWPLDEQMAVCAHELMHVAFRHVSRGRKLRDRFGAAYSPYILNIATDAIINQTLLLAGFQPPRPCVVLTELFREAFSEEITAEHGLAQYDAERLYLRLMDEAQLAGGVRQGAGCGHVSVDGPAGQTAVARAEAYARSKGFRSDMHHARPTTIKEAEEDNEWQQRLARALRLGRLAGRGIGKLGHRLADVPMSRTPWEIILRRLVTKAVTPRPRPSLDRPTRRYLGREADARRRNEPPPAYEPRASRRNRRPRIVIGVDVSGSIPDRILEIFAGEIAAIGNRTGSEIHVLVFDDGVLSETRMQGVDVRSEIRKIDFARGGGTSFVEVIERAVEIDPSVAVILTDLYGPFGEDPRRFQVIWVTPASDPPEVPWGQVVCINS